MCSRASVLYMRPYPCPHGSLLALAITWLAAALLARPLGASTVVGVFAIVDDVRFEPDESAPERIRLSGVFVVPVPMSSGRHKPPERGHVCFTLPQGWEDEARKDWAALKAAAATGQVVGFGEYWVVTARYGNSTANTSLVVEIQKEAESATCQPYPVPNKRGVVTTFDTAGDTNPRFGEPSMVIVSQLLAMHRR